MHSILLNLWLSSVPLWVGLSLAFLLGLAYYWFQNRNYSFSLLSRFQAVLRGLFLVGIVLCFIPWKIAIEESNVLPSKVLLIIDDSQSMNQATYAGFIQDVSKKIQDIASNGGELKIVGLNSPENSIQAIAPVGQNSSWGKVQELIRKESKNFHLSQVFFVTDGQLSDLETPIHRGASVYIVPFGKIVSQQKMGISIPTKTVYSVPGERIHVPVSVWTNFNQGEKSPNIEVLLDGKLYQTLKASGGSWKDFQLVDLELSKSIVGKHAVQIQIENDPSLPQGFTWVIQDFHAKVEAFATSPNPNLGVINRVAQEAKINVHWNFVPSISTLPSADNYLFYGILPKELPKDKSAWYLNIPTEQKKDWPTFEEFGNVGLHFPSLWKKQSDIRTSLWSSNVALWREQMAEVKSTGSYEILDSTLHEMLKISFLRQSDDLFSIELSKPQIKLGEDLFFEVRQLNPELMDKQKIDVQFKIVSTNSTVQFKRTISQAHQIVNFQPSKKGKYQYQAKLVYQGKELEFNGAFTVLDDNPEKIMGRNNANFQVLSHREGVKILESSEIKNLSLNNIEDTKRVSNKEINLWEWPYFGLLMLVLVGLEWIIRKRLNQI